MQLLTCKNVFFSAYSLTGTDGQNSAFAQEYTITDSSPQMVTDNTAGVGELKKKVTILLIEILSNLVLILPY